jgi:type III secretion system low calcium response chaperone LcrH/SycD
MSIQPIHLTKDQEELIELLAHPPYPPEITRGLMKAIMQNNWSLRQIFKDLPHQAFERVYELAKKYYEVGDYNSALALFYPLCMYDHHSYKYLVGCSASLHLLGHLQQAAEGYALAYAADPTNPIPLFYAAECAEKLNGKKQARLLLEQAIAVAGHRKEYQAVKQQAELIRNRLIKQS